MGSNNILQSHNRRSIFCRNILGIYTNINFCSYDSKIFKHLYCLLDKCSVINLN